MDIVGIVSLITGLVSLAAAIAFYALSSRSERRNREILEKINDAIQSWQSQIINSNIDLLNSRVEIVGKKVVLEEAKAKSDFLEELSARIRFIVESRTDGEASCAHAHMLGQLLSTFESVTRPAFKQPADEVHPSEI